MSNSFPNITENLALNFVNSTIDRNDRALNLMKDISSLKKWSETPIANYDYNNQLSIFNSFLEETQSIVEIQNFRDDLYHLLTQLSINEAPVSILTNRIESYLLTHPITIIFIDEKVLSIPVSSGISGIKTLIYLSLTELIKSGEIEYLTSCANEKCPLLFVNSNGRRKWCSMKICGNRNKVERYENKNKNN